MVAAALPLQVIVITIGLPVRRAIIIMAVAWTLYQHTEGSNRASMAGGDTSDQQNAEAYVCMPANMYACSTVHTAQENSILYPAHHKIHSSSTHSCGLSIQIHWC